MFVQWKAVGCAISIRELFAFRNSFNMGARHSAAWLQQPQHCSQPRWANGEVRNHLGAARQQQIGLYLPKKRVHQRKVLYRMSIMLQVSNSVQSNIWHFFVPLTYRWQQNIQLEALLLSSSDMLGYFCIEIVVFLQYVIQATTTNVSLIKETLC